MSEEQVMGEWSGDWQPATDRMCPRCGSSADVEYRTWESSCGGFEDFKFRCRCGHSWWIDGCDA